MISSTQNSKIKLARALLGKSRERQVEQAYVIEGVRLVEEALKAAIPARLVLYTPGLSLRGMNIVRDFATTGTEVIEIPGQIMNSISETETSQGILAILPIRPLPIPERLDFVIIVDNLRDPGNLGSIMRTASAGSVQALLLGPGTTDPYAPKVVRAAMGAHFRLPILSADFSELHALLKNRPEPLTIFLADASQGTSCWQADLRQPCALMVGGEAEGASQEGRSIADFSIHIPMPGKSESLNAAIATAILIFEAVRQRTNPGIAS